MFEQLETRRLLTSLLSNGTLTVTGTDGSDKITLGLSGSSVSVREGSSTRLYGASAVSRVRIDAKSGNDTVSITTSFSKPVTVIGGAGNDTIQGGAANDSLDGGDGNDIIRAGNGNDTMLGGAGADAMFGADGNDFLDGGTGTDFFDGGKGSDTADYRSRSENLSLRLNLFYVPTEGDAAPGGGGASGEKDVFGSIENLNGGRGKDNILVVADGDGEGNVFPPATISGHSGNDAIALHSTNPFGASESGVTLRGGDGDDLFQSEFGFGHLFGDAGNDLFQIDWYIPQHEGGTGNDTARVRLGLGDSDDSYRAGNGIEAIDVQAPNHALVYGNDLDNSINVEGAKYVDGLGGNDRISHTFGSEYERPTLRGGTGNDTITGGLAAESLEGSDGNDVLYGGGGNDSLVGGNGNDALHGQAGNDRLFGGTGKDFLNGGTGADLIDGGSETDTAVADSNDNRIAIEILT